MCTSPPLLFDFLNVFKYGSFSFLHNVKEFVVYVTVIAVVFGL